MTDTFTTRGDASASPPENALITVVTASAGERGLSLMDAVHSVQRQTFANWHHYVLLDGRLPTPLIPTWSGRRSVIMLPFALGPTEPVSTMPHGTPNPVYRWALRHLAMNPGGFVCFLDDDDAYDPEFMATMHAALVLSKDANIAVCGMRTSRPGYDIDGRMELAHCGQSGFMARVWAARSVEYPREEPTDLGTADFQFISQVAAVGANGRPRVVEVRTPLVTYDTTRTR